MMKRNFALSLVFFLCCTFVAGAQMIETKIPEDRTPVWKRHRKYTHIGYEIQNINQNGYGMKSNYGFAIGNGMTFYLHERPIANLMKFGLDWTIFDLSVAGFGTSVVDDEEGGILTRLGNMKLDIGMGVGPSFTINPVDYLKIGVYFHATPTYSMCLTDSGLNGGYATFFNVGAHVSYKVISIGYEYRWCGASKYNALFGGDSSVPSLISTGSSRFYIAFRAGGRKWK